MEKRLPQNPIFKKFQRVHFYFFDILLFIVFLVSIYFVSQNTIMFLDVVTFIIWWTLGVIGIEIGLHRFFSHKSFEANDLLKKILVILASMGGQGRVISWATAHRYHHENSDTEEDLHSPFVAADELIGMSLLQKKIHIINKFINSHIGWKYDYRMPNPYIYGNDLIQDKIIKKYSRYYFFWFLLGLVLPGCIQYLLTFELRDLIAGIIWGGVFRAYLGQNMTWTINSVCHLIGDSKYPSKDNSRNLKWFSLITLGGSLHNNHHFCPRSYTTKISEDDFDPGQYIILFFKKIGWVKNLYKNETFFHENK